MPGTNFNGDGLVRQHLEQFVPKYPNETRQQLNVLVVGGHAVADALWTSGRGHEVTLLEPQRELYDNARAQTDGRLKLVQSDIGTAAVGYSKVYDFVMSHDGALGFEDPQEYVRTLSKTAKSFGLVSLLASGPEGGVTDQINKIMRMSALHLLNSYPIRLGDGNKNLYVARKKATSI